MERKRIRTRELKSSKALYSRVNSCSDLFLWLADRSGYVRGCKQVLFGLEVRCHPGERLRHQSERKGCTEQHGGGGGGGGGGLKGNQFSVFVSKTSFYAIFVRS